MSDVTHAKVKFEEDKSIKIVPIDKIVEFRDVKPVDIHDFDKNVLYRCLWSDEKNCQEVELAVQISDLAVITNEQDLQSLENKRGRFPKINDTIVNEFYDQLENVDDDINKQTSKTVSLKELQSLVNQKNTEKKRAEQKKVQQEILQEKMDKFINSNCLFKIPSNDESDLQENVNEKVQVDIDKERLQHDYATLLERFNELLQTNNNLKKKYSTLEKDNENLRFLNQNLQMKLFVPSEKCNNMQVDQALYTGKSQSNEKKEALDLNISAIPPVVAAEQSEQIHDLLYTSSPILSQGQLHSSKEIEIKNLNCSIDNEMACAYKTDCATPRRKRLHSSSNSDEEASITHVAKKLHFHDHKSQECNMEKIHRDIQKNAKEDDVHKNEGKKIESCSKKMSKTDKKVNEGKENKADNITETNYDNRTKKSKEKNEEKKPKSTKEKHEKKTENTKDEHENNETEELPFLHQSEVVENGEKVIKKYIGEGIHIDQDSWNGMLHVSTSNRFIVALLKHLYTPQQLAKRSLSGSNAWKTPNGVHTRQKMSPKKHRVIQKCTKYYLKKKFKLTKSQLNKEMSCVNKHITGYISKVVNDFKSKKIKADKDDSDDDEEAAAKETSNKSDCGTESDNEN